MSPRVAVLGATGAVGQRLVRLLDPHPDFEIAALTASADSAGRTYRDAAKWRLEAPIPDDVADVTITETDPGAVPDDVALCFSSLPSDVGAAVEPEFVEAGYVVSSNSSNARLDDDVPLTIPEVNPDHLDEVNVVGVDLGDDERHVVVGASVRGVRGDDVAGLAEVRLDPFADAGRERREDELHVVRDGARLGCGHFHVGHAVGDRKSVV